MLTLPWVRDNWLVIWNWLNLIWPFHRRIEENTEHIEEVDLQPIQECGGADDGPDPAQNNIGVQTVGEIDVQNEAVVELQRRNTELTQQLERNEKYYKASKRQSSLQIEKLAQRKLSLQIENEDLKTKLEEANNKTTRNILRNDTVAVG